MSSFLEKAGAAREAATEIRRQMATLEGSARGPTLKRSDRLEAYGAELEYRWLALTRPSQQQLGGWWAWLPSWRRNG